MADKNEKVIFSGRLREYKYYDMDQVIAVALEKAGHLIDVNLGYEGYKKILKYGISFEGKRCKIKR